MLLLFKSSVHIGWSGYLSAHVTGGMSNLLAKTKMEFGIHLIKVKLSCIIRNCEAIARSLFQQ
ncbi:unnamed protein product [Timema podura]|uniref:Uncharacterized protein n=1 Tax=Timema podura TaxID=61482 RepID=A0ABN7NSI8_TIMPD|nr:unnamed protein product [Timema podura]